MEQNKIQIDVTELIDMKQKDFESLLIDNHVSLGDLSNLNFYFRSQYQQILIAKDQLVSSISKGEIEDNEQSRTNLNNLYLLLIDLENKVTFLTNRIKELMQS